MKYGCEMKYAMDIVADYNGDNGDDDDGDDIEDDNDYYLF